MKTVGSTHEARRSRKRRLLAFALVSSALLGAGGLAQATVEPIKGFDCVSTESGTRTGGVCFYDAAGTLVYGPTRPERRQHITVPDPGRVKYVVNNLSENPPANAPADRVCLYARRAGGGYMRLTLQLKAGEMWTYDPHDYVVDGAPPDLAAWYQRGSYFFHPVDEFSIIPMASAPWDSCWTYTQGGVPRNETRDGQDVDQNQQGL